MNIKYQTYHIYIHGFHDGFFQISLRSGTDTQTFHRTKIFLRWRNDATAGEVGLFDEVIEGDHAAVLQASLRWWLAEEMVDLMSENGDLIYFNILKIDKHMVVNQEKI